MAKPDKSAAIEELTDKFKNSNAAVLTEYRGLTVTQLKQLRDALRANASYSVVKNTLTKLAVRNAGIDGLEEHLAGPSAIAFVHGDMAAAAKSVRDFAKDNPLLVIKGGLMDGKPVNAADIIKIADLEPREVILAKLAGVLKAGISKAAYVLNALPTKTAQTVGAYQEKLEQN